MVVDAAGDGVVFGDVKTFRAPDPHDPRTDIWYASIEGPEAALYLRGTAKLAGGRATITFPDHFRNLAAAAGMTVQLTPLSSDSKGLAVVRKGLDGVEVRELHNGAGDYEFDWRVEAARKEHVNFRVVRPWDEMLSSDEDREKAWQARLKSIERRKMRAAAD